MGYNTNLGFLILRMVKVSLQKTHILKHFPSASALEWVEDKLYVIGDDATTLLILNNSYQQLQQIKLFDGAEKRIPKKDKADLEAATILNIRNTPHLLLIGSGSKIPERTVIKLLPVQPDVAKSQVQTFSSLQLVEKLQESGLEFVNIEGATSTHQAMVLANRGNLTSPGNTLIFTDHLFWQHECEVTLAKLILPLTGAGVSGLDYIPETDDLIFTASTEETANAINDGAIGDSYLGIIKNISRKYEQAVIQPDIFINLRKENAAFHGQKIESVCVESVKNGLAQLHLCSDNDDGTSVLFKITVSLH